MTDSSLYLCLDQGGHASRALVIDSNAKIHASAFREIGTRRDGALVEHDPAELVRSLRDSAAEAIAKLGAAAARLQGAGLATQRSSIVCWERDSGAALSPVISWQDTRAAAWLSQYVHHEPRVHAITGLAFSPHYGVSKLRWCLEHLPQVAQAAAAYNLACGPLASYLANQLARPLTRQHTSEAPIMADPANASRTLLWDREARDWSAELLELFAIPRSLLPDSVPSRHDWGRLEVAGIRLPLQVVTGDQSAALFAFGLPNPRTVYANLGTGAFLQRRAADGIKDPGRLLASVVYQDASTGVAVLEGTVNGAGSAISWIAQKLAVDEQTVRKYSADWLNSLDGELVFLNGVAGLGSPWWQADFKSEFAGALAATASAEEKIAAVMESVVFMLAANLKLMNELLGEPHSILLTGGLGRVDPLAQKLASLTGLPVERALTAEATSKGLAYLLAGLPESWPPPIVERTFSPHADSALQARFNFWSGEMPPVAGATWS
jgi:glycerol kinase